MALNFLQVGVIGAYRQRNSRNNEGNPVTTELIAEALQDIYTVSDVSDRLSAGFGYKVGPATHPPMTGTGPAICSEIVLRYAAVAGLLLRKVDYWFPRSKREVDLLFKRVVDVTPYDSWRYPRLREFALAIVGS